MNQLFHSLSRTSDGAMIIDGSHRIIYWNQSAIELLGYEPEEVIGRPCHEVMGGRDEQGRTLCQRFCQIAIQAKNGDILPNRDVYVCTSAGDGRWLNVTTFAYSGGENGVGEVVVHLFRDITEVKGYQQFANSVLVASEQLQRKSSWQSISSTSTRAYDGGLTVRELQVLEMLALGRSTSAIAGTLIISPSTVRNHVQNILSKLGVHSRLEAIAFAYQNGLLDSNNV